jgi:predicted DNA-binding protein YlxM (UPF0122 family)
MANTDKSILAALGLEPVTKIVTRLDLSACLKDRYHHKMTMTQIAVKYGVTKQAVQQKLQTFTDQLGDPEELSGFKDVEAEIQAAIKRRFSSELLSVKLDKCSPKDLAMVYGITYDKNRLQTGQSTSNQSVFFSVVSESDEANTPQIIDVTTDSE